MQGQSRRTSVVSLLKCACAVEREGARGGGQSGVKTCMGAPPTDGCEER